MELLQTIFDIFWGIDSFGNRLLALDFKDLYLSESFSQILNLFLHLQVLEMLLTTTLLWLVLGIAVLGFYIVASVNAQTKKKNQTSKTTGEKFNTYSLQKRQDFQLKTPVKTRPEKVGKSSQEYNSNSKRPYIGLSLDELKGIASSEWNNAKILSTIHYELSFRSRKKAQMLRESLAQRLAQIDKIGFSWPSTVAESGSNELSSDVFKYQEGLLKKFGYRVGISGMPESQRRRLLDNIFLQPLTLGDDAAYLSVWGEPSTARRLQKMAESLAAFTRNAKRRKASSFSKAIQDWESDLAYLKKTYYDGRFNFQWPRTDVLKLKTKQSRKLGQ